MDVRPVVSEATVPLSNTLLLKARPMAGFCGLHWPELLSRPADDQGVWGPGRPLPKSPRGFVELARRHGSTGAGGQKLHVPGHSSRWASASHLRLSSTRDRVVVKRHCTGRVRSLVQSGQRAVCLAAVVESDLAFPARPWGSPGPRQPLASRAGAQVLGSQVAPGEGGRRPGQTSRAAALGSPLRETAGTRPKPCGPCHGQGPFSRRLGSHRDHGLHCFGMPRKGQPGPWARLLPGGHLPCLAPNSAGPPVARTPGKGALGRTAGASDQDVWTAGLSVSP